VFGIFGTVKIKTEVFVETTSALRQFTNIDLAKLTINEQGGLGDRAYEILKAYKPKRKYTRVELVLAGWYEAILASQHGGHTLSGKTVELLKGKADFLLSDQVVYSYDYSDPRYFPPFFYAYATDRLEEIPDGLSRSGKPIKHVFEKMDKHFIQNQQSNGLKKKTKPNQHLKKVSAERKIKNEGIESFDTLSQKHLKVTEKAALVLKYNDKAKRNWSKLKNLPERSKVKFLDALEKDPKQDTSTLVSEIINEALYPYKDEEANEALQRAFKLSEEAGYEFKKVYKTLGQTVPVQKIMAKIEKEYGILASLLKIQQLQSRRLKRNDPALKTTKFFVSKRVEEVAILQAAGYQIIPNKPIFENCSIKRAVGSRITKIQTNKQFSKFIEREIEKIGR